MARHCGAKLRLVRRLGCQLPGLIRIDPDLRRPYPPGQHGPTKRGKLSDYALRLREKQKLRYHYGINERQLKKTMHKSFKGNGNPGLKLLSSLELRSDSVVFRAGFAPTIGASRQMTCHGHIAINGKRNNIPSYMLKIGDTIAPIEKSKMREKIIANQKDPENLSLPSYLEFNDNLFSAKIVANPIRDDIPIIINEQLVVEYYSGS